MGLKEVNSALEKIVGFTEKVSDGVIGNVKIPKVVLNDTLGIESEEVTSISGLISSVKESASNILQITRQIACLKYLFTDGGKMAGDLLGGMVGSVVSIASALALQIANVFATQIQIAISQVLGTVCNTITSICNLLKAIGNLIDAIAKIPDKFAALANINIKWLLDKDECEMMFAEIAACYMAKLLKKLKVFDYANDITNKINEAGFKLNQTIADELNDVNVMNNYLERESFLLEKSTRQINAFSFI